MASFFSSLHQQMVECTSGGGRTENNTIQAILNKMLAHFVLVASIPIYVIYYFITQILRAPFIIIKCCSCSIINFPVLGLLKASSMAECKSIVNSGGSNMAVVRENSRYTNNINLKMETKLSKQVTNFAPLIVTHNAYTDENMRALSNEPYLLNYIKISALIFNLISFIIYASICHIDDDGDDGVCM